MSRLYEALRRLELQNHSPGDVTPNPTQPAELLTSVLSAHVDVDVARAMKTNVSPASRLVALNDPKSLGAEKFRALATRLENARGQRELRSLQVTSSVVNEGKSLVSGNLAITLAKHFRSKVLLIEGDLHRPTLAQLFGLGQMKGLTHWWSGAEEDMGNFLCKLDDMPLWFLSAGEPSDQPSNILQSARFTGAFASLIAAFDWIIVDSTPMQPVVDANLWSRVVDGTLLVVREGVAPIKSLKKGLESLDNPKLIGVVLNEASEFDRGYNGYSYYGASQKEKKRS